MQERLELPTYYLNPLVGSDEQGDGSRSHPFRTLSKALQYLKDRNIRQAILRSPKEEVILVDGKITPCMPQD